MGMIILGVVCMVMGINTSNLILDEIFDNAFIEKCRKGREVQLVLTVLLSIVGFILFVCGIVNIL